MVDTSFQRVRKYPLQYKPGVPQYVQMPYGAEILHVGVQGVEIGYGKICVWALIDTRQSPEARPFIVYETGATITTIGSYVGTVFYDTDVLHVFTAIAG